MTRMLLLGALLGSLPAASTPPGAEKIPLSLYQGKQFTVEAVVAGKSRTFLFDTGEGLTMIDPRLAKEIGCEPWGNITAFRMTGDRLDAKRCDGVAFGIGARRFVAPSTLVYDLGEIAGKDAPPLAGSIGLDLFAGQTITIDLPRRQIVLETAASLKRRLVGAIEVPLRLVRGHRGSVAAGAGPSRFRCGWCGVMRAALT